MQHVSEPASQQVTKTKLRVMIAGGGTGGHVVPALAIGRELRDAHGAVVRFVGTARGLETRMVPEAGFRLELVRSGQLKNVSLSTRLRTLLDLPLGVLHCVSLLREFRPQVVVGVGGYASGPAMIAALLLRVPTVAYEPNAVPGMTNRLLGKRVSAAAVNFAQTTSYFRNAVATGVPVRPEIFALPPRPIAAPPRLLITAGSQGAQVFNQTMPRIAAALLAAVPQLSIVHQAGPRHSESTRAAYAESGADPARWSVEAFLEDMPAQYAAADLVLARSGSTVAELAAAGKPSLLVRWYWPRPVRLSCCCSASLPTRRCCANSPNCCAMRRAARPWRRPLARWPGPARCSGLRRWCCCSPPASNEPKTKGLRILSSALLSSWLLS